MFSFEAGVLAFDHDEKRMIATSDAQAEVLSTQGASRGTKLKGHSERITSAAFSPNGRLIVTTAAASDDTARTWDARSGRSIAVLRAHGATVNSAAFSPDGT